MFAAIFFAAIPLSLHTRVLHIEVRTSIQMQYHLANCERTGGKVHPLGELLSATGFNEAAARGERCLHFQG